MNSATPMQFSLLDSAEAASQQPVLEIVASEGLSFGPRPFRTKRFLATLIALFVLALIVSGLVLAVASGNFGSQNFDFYLVIALLTLLAGVAVLVSQRFVQAGLNDRALSVRSTVITWSQIRSVKRG